MKVKANGYKVAYTLFTTILLFSILIVFAGCKPETVTTTVVEKSTVTSTTTKTEVNTITNTATVTETKTVTATPTTTTSTTSTATSTIATSIVPNDQEQQITSADGKVKILRHELLDKWNTMPYGMCVSGVVKNLTDTSVTAKITIKFYDKTETLLGTETALLPIEPGRSLPFEIYAGLVGVSAGSSYGHYVTSYYIEELTTV